MMNTRGGQMGMANPWGWPPGGGTQGSGTGAGGAPSGPPSTTSRARTRQPLGPGCGDNGLLRAFSSLLLWAMGFGGEDFSNARIASTNPAFLFWLTHKVKSPKVGYIGSAVVWRGP